MVRFVVDETCWLLEDLSALSYVEHIEKILDTIDDLTASGHSCVFSDDLFTSELLQGYTFYDLYQPTAPIPIPRELQRRVAAIFGRLQMWQDLDLPWPENFDASLNSGPVLFAPSIAWAQARAREGVLAAVPCIVHRDRRPVGHIPVQVGELLADVWMISSARDARAYFRWLIVEATDTPEQMADIANDAFPELDFVPGAFQGVKSMSKPYRELTDDIVMHLSALSDHGQRIFKNSWQHASAEFGSLGVNLSDENGNTKSNAGAKRARTREYCGNSLVFWWHSKLQLDRDRIHFCPDAVPQGRAIIVGIFCRHLPT